MATRAYVRDDLYPILFKIAKIILQGALLNTARHDLQCCTSGTQTTVCQSLRQGNHGNAQVYLKYGNIPWVIHGVDLSQGSHGLFIELI